MVKKIIERLVFDLKRTSEFDRVALRLLHVLVEFLVQVTDRLVVRVPSTETMVIVVPLEVAVVVSVIALPRGLYVAIGVSFVVSEQGSLEDVRTWIHIEIVRDSVPLSLDDSDSLLDWFSEPIKLPSSAPMPSSVPILWALFVLDVFFLLFEFLFADVSHTIINSEDGGSVDNLSSTIA